MTQSKKAYFFTLDAILALSVLSIGIFLLFAAYTNAPETAIVNLHAKGVMDVLALTQIQDITNPLIGVNGELWNEGQITNKENTILQQIAAFYAAGNATNAERSAQNITSNIIPSQFLFELWIDGTLVFPQGPSTEHNESKTTTNLMLVERKVVQGFLDEDTGALFGPYVTEIYVWNNFG